MGRICFNSYWTQINTDFQDFLLVFTRNSKLATRNTSYRYVSGLFVAEHYSWYLVSSLWFLVSKFDSRLVSRYRYPVPGI
jgi:hypothetical protein